MGFFTGMKGRKAYAAHLKGNKLSDQHRVQEAKAAHKEAMELYQQAMDEGDRTPRYMMAYGVLLMRDRQFDRARDLMLATEKAPGLTKEEKRQLRINFGICEWKLGHLDNAIQQMRNAGYDNMNSMIYGSLGYMLIEKARETGDFEEAVKFNEEALDYDDEDAVVLDNMGQLNLAMGDRAKALEFFEKAHKQKPSQVDTLYYLAKLAAEDGKPDAAKAYLETALEGNFSALCTTTREMAQELLDSINN